MKQKTEATQDYYVLFRDAKAPAPNDDEYKERCEQRYLLIGDKASFVWGYVGKLSDGQAERVKRLLSHIDKRLMRERTSLLTTSDDKNEKNFIRRRQGVMYITLIKPTAANFLAEISPNLSFLSHVPLKKCIKIYPESAEEKRRIIEALLPHSSQQKLGIRFNYNPKGYESSKLYRSFIELFSGETLVDMLQSVGCSPHKDLLRRMVEVWVIETLERRSRNRSKRYRLEKKIDPEYIKKCIGSIFDGKYISTLTPRQLEIFGECLAIANSIRRSQSYQGLREKIVKNKYKAMLTWKIADCSNHPPLFQVADEQAVPSVINGNSATYCRWARRSFGGLFVSGC